MSERNILEEKVNIQMKRTACAISAAALLSVAACAQGQSETGNIQLNGKKTLVVYYSATGTTKGVAEKIAKIIGADLLEIELEEPYSSADLNWTNNKSRVCVEHERIFEGRANGQATVDGMKKVLPGLKNEMPNFAEYDTVFVGYPIWWGVSAWPLSSFVTKANLDSTTVIPFCTSMSTPLGRSDILLKEIAGGKENWKAGKRFGTRATESEVSAWLSKIGVR